MLLDEQAEEFIQLLRDAANISGISDEVLAAVEATAILAAAAELSKEEAEAAANEIREYIIPEQATYTAEAIDEGNMTMLNMILSNKANIENIIITGLN